MVNISIYTNSTSYENKNIFGTIPGNDIIDPNRITLEQLDALKRVNESYTVYLAAKQYQKIPKNYGRYIDLLAKIKTITVEDPNIQILIKIATDGLIGSNNSVSIFNQFAFKEIALLELKNRISDILSNKNRQQALHCSKSTVEIVQVMNFGPLFSRYISLYGMPEFGVGFDAAKLAVLHSIKI